ncbi:hypothetical protein OYC64_006238 [Pagothenia borchgrevinki]|uniref:Immunoglobulin V-set domain-containing protein n=1 Tax=Pagothenia borchgrevinki TaxID=8213 RepID=A0ABD2GI85_PAGBO
MSAVCLKIMTILCLSATPGSSGVVRKLIGEYVTIQCRPPPKDQDSLTLNKGLNMESEVFKIHGASEKVTIAKDIQDRLQYNGVFPKIDILIKNMTSKDTDTYWCVYKKVEGTSPVTKNGEGSILLVVVTEPQTDRGSVPCEQSNNNLILVSVVICAAVLLGIIICFLVWIIPKTKSLRSAKKPRRVATNDVYEEMRGTIRR